MATNDIAAVDAFLAEVRAEIERGREKFPGAELKTVALSEEYGELMKAVLDELSAACWKEAVQTAAMACPSCGRSSRTTQTRHGRRDDCAPCRMHSWDGKPLVSQEVHEARKHCHEVFDRIWKSAEAGYEIEEAPGTPEHEKAVRRVRKSMRVRAYRYIAFTTGMPEPECHMAQQQDVEKLRAIYRAAREATPEIVRAWWYREGRDWWASEGRERAA